MKKGIWKLILGILLLIGSFSLIGDGSADSIFGFVVGIALIAWWYLSNKKATRAKEEKLNGYLKYKVVGVVYNNDDGTDRQEILASIFARGCTTVATFKPYKYQGENALYVMTDFGCVGVITKEKVAEVSEVVKMHPTAKLVVDFAKNNQFTADVIFNGD